MHSFTGFFKTYWQNCLKVSRSRIFPREYTRRTTSLKSSIFISHAVHQCPVLLVATYNHLDDIGSFAFNWGDQ